MIRCSNAHYGNLFVRCFNELDEFTSHLAATFLIGWMTAAFGVNLELLNSTRLAVSGFLTAIVFCLNFQHV